MRSPDGLPARMDAVRERERQKRLDSAARQIEGSQFTSTPAWNGGNLRVLMANGKWLIPQQERPKLADPPREYTIEERRMERAIWGNNGLIS